MMNFEDDTHPNFDFGQSEDELQEIENMISQFEKFPPTLPKLTKQKCLAAIEIKTKQPQAIMNQVMADASASTSTSQFFGISGINKIISQLPEQHVLTFSVNPRMK